MGELEATVTFEKLEAEYPGLIAEIGHNSEAYHAAIEATDAVATRLATSNTTGLRGDIRDRLAVEVHAVSSDIRNPARIASH